MVRALSYGGGVQTCYLLFKYPERYDHVIFADVSNGDHEHGEYPITYEILEKIAKPFCKDHNIPFHIVTHKDGSVWERSMKNKIIPMVHPRWCTQDHKVATITKFIRKQLKANFPENVVISEIGISYDEGHRANFTQKYKYNKLEYPLVDSKTTRQQCIDWLTDNYPDIDWNNAKSGCWFCPFWKRGKYLQLPKEQKQELIQLEKNGKHYPRITLKPGHTIEHYMREDLHKLEEFMDEGCDSGHCFV